jgi:hypothetical protein
MCIIYILTGSLYIGPPVFFALGQKADDFPFITAVDPGPPLGETIMARFS